jgi:hypothetical protein
VTFSLKEMKVKAHFFSLVSFAFSLFSNWLFIASFVFVFVFVLS